MSMTRQHFESIAATIKASFTEEARLKDKGHTTPEEFMAAMTALELLAINLTDVFSAANPNFNAAKFLKACSLDAYTVEEIH